MIVVDDHAIFRMGVVQALSKSDDLRVVGEGSSAADAVTLAERLEPDVALIDISMQGGGIAGAREINARWPSVRIIMLTVSEEDDDVLQALDAGVAGYVLKGVPAPELISVVKSVHTGLSYIAPNLGLKLFNVMRERSEPDKLSSQIASLTPKEKNAFELLAKGYSNRQISQEMGVQVKTTKFHVSRLLAKLGVRSRVEAALVAQRYFDQR